MGVSKTRTKSTWKGMTAVLAITAIFAMAGRSLAPAMPATTWLFWCVAAAFALFVAVVGGLIVSLQLRQLVLRKGGTDVQWLAFSSDPEGLVFLSKPSRSRAGQSIHEGLVFRERADER